MTFDSLSAHEQRVLATLIRALVRADGVVTPQEAGAIGALVGSLGPGLGKLLSEVGSFHEQAELRELARSVEREDVQLWIYTVLVDLAESDGLVAAEKHVLDAVSEAWDLVD